MRPSGENRTTVGFVSPLKTVVSWNPAGRVPATAGVAVTNAMIPLAVRSTRLINTDVHRRLALLLARAAPFPEIEPWYGRDVLMRPNMTVPPLPGDGGV